MSRNTDPAGIQRKHESLATEPNCTDVAASQDSVLLQRLPSDAGLRLSGVRLLARRLPVLGVGLALGAAFSLLVAGVMMPSGMEVADRGVIWVYVMGGPIVGTAWGMSEFCPAILLGWLGLLLIPAHPCCPYPAMGCVTLIGFSLWYFAGFLAATMAVWGA